MSKDEHEQLYKEFCDWSPGHARMVSRYEPWGSTSIVIWLHNGMLYKVKKHGANRFTMQTVSEADIRKKFGLE